MLCVRLWIFQEEIIKCVVINVASGRIKIKLLKYGTHNSRRMPNVSENQSVKAMDV